MILLIGATLVGQTSCSTSVEARRTSKNAPKSKSAGPSDVLRKTVTTAALTDIAASSAVAIYYTTDNSVRGAEIKMQADDDVRDHIYMEVGNGRLEVSIAANVLRDRNVYDPPVKVWIRNNSQLSRVSLMGACSFNTDEDYVASRSLQLRGDGACSFNFPEIRLEGRSRLDIDLSGACSVTAESYSGEVLKIAASGASTVKIDDIDAPKATIVSSGACDVKVPDLVCDALTAQSDGVAHLYLGGKAGVATLSASGLASLDAGQLSVGKLTMSRSSEATLNYSDDSRVVSSSTSTSTSTSSSSTFNPLPSSFYEEDEIPEP